MTDIEYAGVSSDGKYRNGKNQVALTTIGDTDVSTIWWKRTPGGGDWFETLLFRDSKALTSVPQTYSTEAEALRGHAAAIVKLAGEDEKAETITTGIGPSPCAYCDSRDHIESGCPKAAPEVPALDKQVVYVRGRHFSALVNSGVDTHEFDRGLAALGIELIISEEEG